MQISPTDPKYRVGCVGLISFPRARADPTLHRHEEAPTRWPGPWSLCSCTQRFGGCDDMFVPSKKPLIDCHRKSRRGFHVDFGSKLHTHIVSNTTDSADTKASASPDDRLITACPWCDLMMLVFSNSLILHSCFVFSCASRKWPRPNIGLSTTLPELDCLCLGATPSNEKHNLKPSKN